MITSFAARLRMLLRGPALIVLACVSCGGPSCSGCAPSSQPSSRTAASVGPVVSATPPIELRDGVTADLAFTQADVGGLRAWRARVPLERADAAWRAVQTRASARGLVPLLWLAPPQTLDNLDGHDAPRAVPDAPGVLARRAKELEDRASKLHALLLARTDDANRIALELAPSAVERALRRATPSPPEELAKVRGRTADATSSLNAEPVTLVVFEASELAVLRLFVGGAELEPEPEALEAVLDRWRSLYGAMPMAWDGHNLRLAIDRPPRDLDEARRMALELYLLCPGNAAGRTLTPDSPALLLAQILSREWECRWFEE